MIFNAEIAREIAKRNRKRQYIETTTGLKEVIETTLSFIPEKERKEAVKKSCQRCFQALRIDVNQEFEVLESFLTKLPGILRGRKLDSICKRPVYLRHLRLRDRSCGL